MNHAKVQALYLLKIRATETVRYLAVMMGRSEATIHYWLKLYKTGGLDKLLEEHPQTGRPKKLEVETVALIQRELSDPQGFSSYQEIQLWLLTCQNQAVNYATIYRIVRYELVGKLKVPRPIHEKQQPGVVAVFRDYFPLKIQGLKTKIRNKWGENTKICYWCQDETRLGYRTQGGRQITLKGVKPTQAFQ